MRKLASVAAITVTGAVAVWSCSVPDFQFDPPSTADTTTAVDSSAATTTRSTADSSSSSDTSSTASTASSTSASTGASSSGTGGMSNVGVPCLTEPCTKTEVCCVKGDDADNTHACKTNAGACMDTPISCRVDGDCGAGYHCCGQFGNDGWPSAVFCSQQCTGGGVLQMCADSSECGAKTCQQAFCKCNPNDPTCFCIQGNCTAILPLICATTPYHACF